MTDKLIDCPNCEEKACCYQTPLNEFHNSYTCFGCGYTTNDLMKNNNDFNFAEFESNLPELYKDIKKVDHQNRVWYPQALNILGKGTVFANGKTKDTWQWAAIKSIELTNEDKENPKFKGQTHKSDSQSLKDFGNDFVEALDYIGFFNV